MDLDTRYIGCGAWVLVERYGSTVWDRPRTKKELREILTADSHKVHLDCTDAFGPMHRAVVSADNIGDNEVWIVTGPDPYTSRRWYADIQRNKAGKLTVK